jgi:hypothetical protein
MCALAPLAPALVAPEPSGLPVLVTGAACLLAFLWWGCRRMRESREGQPRAEPPKQQAGRPLPSGTAFRPRRAKQ